MDDERLERALAALPLEEPPPELRARILAATVYRAVPDIATWQIWLIGTLLAVATWTLIAAAGGTSFEGSIGGFIHAAVSLAGSASAVWVGLGLSATLWVMFLSTPGRTISLAGR